MRAHGRKNFKGRGHIIEVRNMIIIVFVVIRIDTMHNIVVLHRRRSKICMNMHSKKVKHQKLQKVKNLNPLITLFPIASI